MKKKYILDLGADILGSFLLGAGIYSFAEKVNIAPGGASGIGIMLKYLCGFPVGLIVLLLNIPLVIIAYKNIGKRFTKRTIRTILLNSVILDAIVSPYFPQYQGDRMLGAVFGGVCMGTGLGIILLRGSTTGGSDIISCLVEKKYPHIQVGKALMMIDSLILLSSMLVFKNIESALFGIVALFCQTKIIDSIVYGVEKGRQILIISEKNETIAKRIIEERRRGATFLVAKGAYLKKNTSVLMCVIRNWEYHYIKEIVMSEDANAFIIVSEAERIVGEGFSLKEKN